MNDTTKFLVDRSVLALTAYAEGRGDSHEGRSSVEERIAIMCVVRNRRLHFERYRAADASYKAVCLAPLQFSCWNTPAAGVRDANHDALVVLAERMVVGQPPDPLVAETLYLADGVISGALLDATRGATSYYAPAAMQPPGRVPTWAKDVPAVQIGSQFFLVV